MEKKYPADRFRGKYLAKKKKSYTEQTIFHGEKCWKKILGCVQTDATTPNIVAPTMLAVVGQQCCVRLHGALHL